MIRHSFPGLVHFSYSLVNMECQSVGKVGAGGGTA